MPNVEMLLQVIEEYCTRTGQPRTCLAAGMGMSMPTFYSRINGESDWRVSESLAFAAITGISREKWFAIFFNPDVN